MSWVVWLSFGFTNGRYMMNAMKLTPDSYVHCVPSSSNHESIVPSGVTPDDYLAFSRADLSDVDTPRSRINAFGNSKRALHFQLFTILQALGFNAILKKACYPKQIALAQACGILTPRIVTKLNILRNAVEHDYYVPTRVEAEDAADLVELFLHATRWVVHTFPTYVELTSENYDESPAKGVFLGLTAEVNSGCIIVNIREPAGLTNETINVTDTPLYEKWVAFLLENGRTN